MADSSNDVGDVVDGMIFHDWKSPLTLTPYMPAGWRSWIERRTDIGGPLVTRSNWLYKRPPRDRVSGSHPSQSGPAISEYEHVKTQVLDRGRRARVVLGYDDALLTTAYPKPYAASVMVRAANDWTIDQWLSRNKRLLGLILVSTSLPLEAAAEIRRAGKNNQMVGVTLGANSLGRPFGDPIYHPIYEAAAEFDLPIVIQVGSDAAADLSAPPVAGGLPSTYGEYEALGAQSHMSHSVSLIVESVFDVFPNLRVLLIGGGVTWVPGYLWRLDYWYKMAPWEAPWIHDLPSAYFRNHFFLGTYALESFADPKRLGQVLTALPGLESTLLYTSGIPNADAVEPASVAARLPEAWHDMVFRTTAERAFRWPDRVATTAYRAPIDLTRLSDMPAPVTR